MRWEVVPGSPRLIVSSPSALFPSGPVSVKELRESPRSPGRYLLVLSDGRELVVGIEALADNGATRVGVVLSDVQVDRLAHAGAVTAMVDKALNSLAHGRRTRRELQQRLRRHQPDARIVDEALDRLEAAGILSDTDVARSEASSRLRRGEGPGRVRQTLRRKGIDARGSDQAVAEAVEADGLDEVVACRQQAEKRMRSLQTLEPAVARRRLVAFLQRRGYSGTVIRRVLDEMARE